jgi:hypothetical protein
MLFMASALTVAPIPPQARHDADCVEATSWALSWMKDQEAIQNVRDVNYYYLGRLTARDEKIDWAMSLSRDMNVNAKPSEETYSQRLSQCADEMGARLLTPAVQTGLAHLPATQPHN